MNFANTTLLLLVSHVATFYSNLDYEYLNLYMAST